MYKIVFFCIPAHGHTNPTLGVVRELIAGGHQVWYYSYEMMREKIESTGATFIPCDQYDQEQKLTPKDAARIGKDLAFSTQVLVDTTLALDAHVCADMEKLQPDCIVADSMAIWGKAVALKLGIPFVSSTTTFAFNKDVAKQMPQRTGELFSMITALPKIRKHIKRLQRGGYPVENIIDLIQSDEKTNTIVYTSPEFQPCSDTFPRKFVFVGPSVRPAAASIEKTRKNLIYISMGTVNNDMLPLYQSCISAFAHTDHQVILSVGDLVSLESFGTLPENVSVYPHVDQIAVLQKADVFLSHCGMNSVTESLYFGVPLIMLPQTWEQNCVSAQVCRLGAGIKLEKADTSSILEAAEQILADPAYKQNARAIAESFKASSGAKGAADKIIQVCESGQPGPKTR